LVFVATAIFAPVATGLGDGLAVAVDVVPPQAAASSAMVASALATDGFVCMHPIQNRVTC